MFISVVSSNFVFPRVIIFSFFYGLKSICSLPKYVGIYLRELFFAKKKRVVVNLQRG